MSTEHRADHTADEFYRPTQDERTLACISHLSVFVSSIGFLVAVGLWIYLHTRKNQPYGAFQAGQAVIFQLLVMVLTVIVILIVMAFAFGAFGLAFAASSGTGEVAFGIAMTVGIMVFVVSIMVVTFAFYAYAIYAAVRSYQAQPFRIPLVGLLAEMISPMPDVRGEHRP
ncbi:MAG: DUF4870 domain-containing protein [Sphaerobacteraceae bacterium]|nr:MAG: DUF4870 domain-containing protein [Sphaerobacteraceae bacterium]